MEKRKQRRGDARGEMRVKVVPYSYTQLAEWRYQIIADAFAMPGTVSFDLDEKLNALVIGVASDAFQRVSASLRTIAALKGVPGNALSFEQDTILQYTGNDSASTDSVSVTGHVRPIAGGLMISRGYGGDGSACTLAFVIRDENGVPYGITNTHCGAWGFVDGYAWGQPTIYNPIGSETRDAAWWACGYWNSEKCRNSDTALIDVSGQNFYEEAIVKIQESGPQPYRTLHSTTTPYLTLAWEVPESIYNDPVRKVGANSGLTAGHITATCVSIHVWGNDHAMPCQDKADYGSGDGDSGSPVYQTYGSTEAILYGVHHGRGFGSCCGHFSPMWLIRWDYPDLILLPW